MSKWNCFAAGWATAMVIFLFVVAICETDFSSSVGPGNSQTIYPNDSDGPALISTLDLQRELNRRDPKLKLVEDGVCGRVTQAAWDRAIGDQYAVSLWPEDAK